jgi:hypothetical protein
MIEYLWILASFALTIGWFYTKDTIRTDRNSGDMDIYTSTIAIIVIWFVYKIIKKISKGNII